jgi:hypothetical protein
MVIYVGLPLLMAKFAPSTPDSAPSFTTAKAAHRLCGRDDFPWANNRVCIIGIASQGDCPAEGVDAFDFDNLESKERVIRA